jgi:hypothetical protein
MRPNTVAVSNIARQFSSLSAPAKVFSTAAQSAGDAAPNFPFFYQLPAETGILPLSLQLSVQPH